MKARKCYLILAIVVGILCGSVIADTQSPVDKPASAGRANPALVGIRQLYVIILPLYAELNMDGPFWQELQVQVKQSIAKAGIIVLPDPYVGRPFGAENIAELRVNIDMIRVSNLQRYVYRIQTSLSVDTRLEVDPSFFVKSDVWTVGTTVQPRSVQEEFATVGNLVLEQVEAFIGAWLSANRRTVQPSRADSSDAVSPEAVKERAKPAEKPATAEYKYVSSKNSKIFHKPECPWARRIRPKNLVGYNSRDEAIKAGKRPCKMCKP